MKNSQKHHYLPQFFLKGFVNQTGQFTIFDHNKGVIKKKTFFPSSHFFEVNRNTVEFKDDSSDFPEKSYAKKDNRYSKLFNIIQSTEGIPELTTLQMLTLQEFVCNLFWRIPKNDKLYGEEFKRNSLFNSFYKMKDKLTGEVVDNEQTRELLNSEAFRKSIRPVVSDLSFMVNKSEDIQNWRISYGPGDFHVCSDNPIILKDENSTDIFNTNFILPLTKNHLLVRSLKPISYTMLEPEFGLKVDFITFLQGNTFTACARRDFLQMISIVSQRFNLVNLKKSVFDYLS